MELPVVVIGAGPAGLAAAAQAVERGLPVVVLEAGPSAGSSVRARGALGLRAADAVRTGRVTLVTGFRTGADEADEDGRLVLMSFEGRRLDPVDEVVVLTGFRPDLSWLSEVRLDLDPVLQAPRELAPLIDPNVHSCGTVYPHGAHELAQPEPWLFLVGMKSYGRAPTFLTLTGYEQTRSVVAAIAGDRAAADPVELLLPETGVCGGSGLLDGPADADAGGCCGPADPALVGIRAKRAPASETASSQLRLACRRFWRPRS